MAITEIKIHPAIGIARVGNSTYQNEGEGYFVGPEIPRKTPDPGNGGYKDSEGRIKRQAVRFRLFAYHDDGTVEEITTANSDRIQWTVRLANTKAAAEKFEEPSQLRNPEITGIARQGLKIRSGPQTLDSPEQTKKLAGTFTYPISSRANRIITVDISLGDIRMETEGQLLVLGGFGISASPVDIPLTRDTFADNDGWYDDVSDGPITATVTIDGQPLTAKGAWVIVAPPDFAPDIGNSTTLYDTIFDFFVRNGRKTIPTKPSFARDIYPVIEASYKSINLFNLENTPYHNTLTPNSDEDHWKNLSGYIFSRLKVPDSDSHNKQQNMPRLARATLTSTQYKIMEKWQDGTYEWDGFPEPSDEISPEGLDRAALESCVGAAFYPGIEAGNFLIEDINRYFPDSDEFRLDHNEVNPGDVTAQMALPWQDDFFACSKQEWQSIYGVEAWWP